MNSCVVEGYELPVGERLHIAMTATHYMSDIFPDPYKFDIDRYLAPRHEHRSPGYAPYGLGTHKCLGNPVDGAAPGGQPADAGALLHDRGCPPAKYNRKLRFNPFPSIKPSKKLKFRIAEQRRELPA